jgi:hypothetical protein
MPAAEPIFITPRMLPRGWGAADLGGWCAGAPRPALPVGEIWLAHPYNHTSDGEPIGEIIARAPEDMLGDLGRAPPLLRLIHTDALAGPLFSDSAIAAWRILEAKRGAGLSVGALAGQRRKFACRPGDAFRVSWDDALEFSPGIVALEARPNFLPRNDVASTAKAARLTSDGKRDRSTLLRDNALSVEVWTLPGHSTLRPDGETCHVLVALSEGIKINSQPLKKGAAVFLPAHGAPAQLSGEGAQMLVAYPDIVPTAIWRHVGETDLALDGAWIGQASARRTGNRA